MTLRKKLRKKLTSILKTLETMTNELADMHEIINSAKKSKKSKKKG